MARSIPVRRKGTREMVIVSSLFEVHRLNEEGLQKAELIAQAFDTLLNGLATVCNAEDREFSIVRTKLEEAAFFAKKSMAKQSENQA